MSYTKEQRVINSMLNSTSKERSQPVTNKDTEGFVIPNHSGDHSAGHVNSTPVNDSDIANKAYVDSLVPAGVISAYGGNSAPSGWFLCDGSEVNRTTYAALFSAIGINFGPGDSFSTFNLPDLRGMFIRGAGTNGSLQDANGDYYNGNFVGNHANDSFQGHLHSVDPPSTSTGNQSASHTHESGWYVRDTEYGTITDTNGQVSAGTGNVVQRNTGTFTRYNPRTSTQSASHTHSVNISAFDSAVPKTDGSNGTPRTAVETKPVNYSVNFIIKY